MRRMASDTEWLQDDPRRISADMIVADLLRQWPRTAEEFVHAGMACVGCAMAPFDTIREAAANYRLDLERFIARLKRIAAPVNPETGRTAGCTDMEEERK